MEELDATRRKIADSVKSPACLQFLDYWLSLPRQDGRALKDAFDPIAIPRLMSNVMILDVTDPRDAVVRLCGTELVERIGVDLTGKSYREYVEAERAEQAVRSLSVVAHTPCLMHAWLQHSKQKYTDMTSDVIGVPLASPDGERLFTYTFTDVIEESDPHRFRPGAQRDHAALAHLLRDRLRRAGRRGGRDGGGVGDGRRHSQPEGFGPRLSRTPDQVQGRVRHIVTAAAPCPRRARASAAPRRARPSAWARIGVTCRGRRLPGA